MNIPIYNVIDNKVIDWSEIVLCLFENCNLSCSFCPQDHASNKYTSEFDILSKVPGTIKWINDNQRSSKIYIHVMGGELFQDRLIALGYLNIYQKLIDQIRKGVNSDKTIIFRFVTNLTMTSHSKLIDFITSNDIKISISYDIKGRFNNANAKLFKDNLNIFYDYIEMCSVVSTKQNIHALLNGDDMYDYLYANFKINWDSYLPSHSLDEKLMPKSSDILKLNKHLLQYYPKCTSISNFIDNNINNKMSCTRGNSYTVLPSGPITTGCSGNILTTSATSDGDIVESFIDKYNCLTCEYYHRCPFTCFVYKDSSKLVDDMPGICINYETFKYAENIIR
jgi:hypothetical protein